MDPVVRLGDDKEGVSQSTRLHTVHVQACQPFEPIHLRQTCTDLGFAAKIHANSHQAAWSLESPGNPPETTL